MEARTAFAKPTTPALPAAFGTIRPSGSRPASLAASTRITPTPFSLTRDVAAKPGAPLGTTSIVLIVVGAALLIVVVTLLVVFLTKAQAARNAAKRLAQRGPALAGGLGVQSSTNVIAGPLVNLASTGIPANLLANVTVPPMSTLPTGDVQTQTRPITPGETLSSLPSLAQVAGPQFPSPPPPPRQQFMDGNLEPMHVGRKTNFAQQALDTVGAVQNSALDTYFQPQAATSTTTMSQRPQPQAPGGFMETLTADTAEQLLQGGRALVIVVVSESCGACREMKKRLQGLVQSGALPADAFALLPMEHSRNVRGGRAFPASAIPAMFKVAANGQVTPGPIGLQADPAATVAYITS